MNQRWKKIAGMTGLVVAAALVRCLNWSAVYVEGSFHLPVIDGMYHLRVVELMLTGNWSWPLFDPWLAYPTGAMPYWPPGFDWLLAMLSWPVFKMADMSTVKIWLGWCMPVLGALVPLVVYRILLRTVRSRWTAMIGTAAAVLEWGLMRPGMLGTIDHHVVALLMTGLLLLLLLREPGLNTDRFCGVLVGLAPLLFPGAWLMPVLLAGVLAFRVLLNPEVKEMVHWRRSFGWAFVVSVPVVMISGFLWTQPFSFIYPSWLHLALYATGWLVPMLLISAVQRGLRPRTAAIGMFVVLGMVAVITAGSELMDILLRHEPNAMVVGESRPLLVFYSPAHFLFRPLYWLLPLSLWGLVRGLKRTDPRAVTLLPMLIGTAVLAVLQVRFEPIFAIVQLVAAVWVMERCWFFLQKRHVRFGIPLLHTFVGIIIATQILFLWGGWQYYSQNTLPRSYRLDRTMDAVSLITPYPGNILDTRARPEYGILAPRWHEGHHLLFEARRAAVATPFGGTAPFTDRIADALRVLTAKNGADILKVCRLTDARYLLIRETRGDAYQRYVEAATAMLGPDPENRRASAAADSFINRMCRGEVESPAFELLWREPAHPSIRDADRFRLYEVHQVIHIPGE